MKFLCKALSLALLLSVSVRAEVDMKSMLPWCAAAVAGEYCYQNRCCDKTRSPEKSPAQRMATEIIESAASGILVSAVTSQQTIGMESVLLNTIKSYCALKLARSTTVCEALNNVPCVRGLVCDGEGCPKTMSAQGIARHGIAYAVVNKIVDGLRGAMSEMIKTEGKAPMVSSQVSETSKK